MNRAIERNIADEQVHIKCSILILNFAQAALRRNRKLLVRGLIQAYHVWYTLLMNT